MDKSKERLGNQERLEHDEEQIEDVVSVREEMQDRTSNLYLQEVRAGSGSSRSRANLNLAG